MPAVREFLRSFRERYCMYRYPLAAPRPLNPPAVSGLSWELLDASAISRCFATERRYSTAFQRFLQQGSIGVCISSGGEWATHAWMAQPGHARPPHIAGNVAPHAFWIYFCATKYGFGNKGLYKFAQRLLIKEAFNRTPAPAVLIDTSPDNNLSRRAITSTCFEPYGMLYCTYICMPGIARMPLSCRWDQAAPHPPLP
jgi:hypothetical protein